MAASMMFRAVFWVVLQCKMITRQYNPEDSSEHQKGITCLFLRVLQSTRRCTSRFMSVCRRNCLKHLKVWAVTLVLQHDNALAHQCCLCIMFLYCMLTACVKIVITFKCTQITYKFKLIPLTLMLTVCWLTKRGGRRGAEYVLMKKEKWDGRMYNLAQLCNLFRRSTTGTVWRCMETFSWVFCRYHLSIWVC
jgi:hypothetical protein